MKEEDVYTNLNMKQILHEIAYNEKTVLNVIE